MMPVLYSTASALKRRLSESFNKPDHVDLGPDLHWVLMEGDWQVRSNAAEAIGAGLNYAVPDVDVTGHQRATITITSLVAGPGVVVRATNTDSDGYLGRVLWDGTWELYKIVNGAVTLLGSTAGAVPATPFDLTLSVAGSTLTLQHNGTSKLTATDSSLGASRKKVGIRSFGAGDRIDHLVAENVRPSVQVRVALDTDPLAPPVWTDFSDRLGELRVFSGRQQELDAFQPGTLGGVFDNSDRSLDPLHATGPHYGKLKPRKRINVRAVFGDTAHDVASGFVHGWPQSYAHPEGSASDLSATDAFLLLASADLPGSVYEHVVREDEPYAWWRLGEMEGNRARDSGPRRFDGTYVGGATFNTREGLVFGDDDNAIEFDGTSHAVGVAGAEITSLPFSIECWIKTDQPASSVVKVIYAQGAGARLRMFVGTDGRVGIVNGNVSTRSTNVVTDNRIHHVVATCTSTSLRIYVDGVDRSDNTVTSAPVPEGKNVYLAHTGIWERYAGVLDEVATYTRELTAAEIAEHHTAGTKPWDGDTTGARVNRILDLVGWPAGERDIDTGNSVLGPAKLGRQKALAYLQLVEATEQGALFVQPDNYVRFRERHARFLDPRMTTPQWTLTDEDAPGALHYEGDLQVHYDMTLVYNEVRVTWTGGEVVVEDPASITAHGRQSHTVDTIASTMSDARGIAEWVLDHHREPQPRLASVTVNPGVDPFLWELALESKIGDRLTLRRHPQQVGDPIVLDAHAEGKEHVFDTKSWTTTLPLSTADTRQYWVLGTSALGSTTALAY